MTAKLESRRKKIVNKLQVKQRSIEPKMVENTLEFIKPRNIQCHLSPQKM